jgi:hypothetical protein
MADTIPNISTFYTSIMKEKPLMFKYQFLVDFSLTNIRIDTKSDLATYYAQSASIPKVELVKANTAFYGIQFRLPSTIKYEHDWTVKFLLNQNMYVYNSILNWMNSISNWDNSGGSVAALGGTKSLNQRNNATADLKFHLLDSTHNNIIDTFTLVGCWPTNIGELQLEYKQDDNTPMTFDCKFKYQYCFRGPNDPLASTTK